MNENRGKLLIIGFGPGSAEHITERARTALQESDVVIGYNTYVDLIRDLMTGQQIVRTGMTEEVSRAQEAVRQAEMGKKVAVISSGDAGVYGMAGLVYEVLIEKGWKEAQGVEVEVIPGISAINSCASLLGAPVMHDACTISLSDHLTPWETIAKRIEAAAYADFVIALYNPRSGRRTRQIVETQAILLKHRSPDTPVGLVKSAYRDREHVVVTTLSKMLENDIGMLTTVIIGNSTTFVYDGKIITPRGYQRKYTLDTAEQRLKPAERLRTEAEPWSLNAQAPDWEAAQPDRGPAPGAGAAGAYAASGASAAGAVGATAAGTAIGAAAPWAGGGRAASPEVLAAGPERSATGARAGTAVAEKPQPVVSLGAVELAMEALERVRGPIAAPAADSQPSRTKQVSIFEVAVAPGIANKKLTNRQMLLLAEIAGDSGEMEYTPNHHFVLRIPTDEPERIVARLKEANLLVFPIGDVAQVKACDFCNLEKTDAIPVAEQLNLSFGGLRTPKELHVAVNGCGMACYGAVLEDIGLVYRRGAYDLFLGGKKIGRNAHSGICVAEGIPAEEIVGTVERIFAEYAEKGHPNERFHKFFKRMGKVAGFAYNADAAPVEVDPVCGD
ncbi:precorrin-3B C(17)-methyltransferase [Paenibacillus turpanensis]|uniref:precorrin-3B C(17)-methyltransferase n=1 Tax=Paenibacillus turpanensis TaxID=2689078 RepID=UPI00140C7679|nr:precorrin-3B C(17)-methyltransferase [Paenibacillus turpanensis]